MSMFHNSPEAEKLATAWHWFALWASLAEVFSALLCFAVGLLFHFGLHTLALLLLPYASASLIASSLACIVAACGQVAFHVKAIFDHAHNRRQLEQKKRMSLLDPDKWGKVRIENMATLDEGGRAGD